MDARHWKKIAFLVAAPASVAAVIYITYSGLKKRGSRKSVRFEESVNVYEKEKSVADIVSESDINKQPVHAEPSKEISVVQATADPIVQDETNKTVEDNDDTMIEETKETRDETTVTSPRSTPIKIRHKSHKSSTSSNSWSDIVDDEESLTIEQDLEDIPETTDAVLDESQLSSKLSSLELNDNKRVGPRSDRIQDSGVVSPASPDESTGPQVAPAAVKSVQRTKRPSIGAGPGLGGSVCGEDNNDRHNSIHKNIIFKYMFSIPDLYCGKLIGAGGAHVKYLGSESKCKVTLRDSSTRHGKKQTSEPRVCTIEGTKDGIELCLELIRDRFPIDHYPDLTLEQIKPANQPDPTATSLALAHGVDQDLIVSAIASGGQIFVQQPNQPSFQFLPRLQACLRRCYSELQCPQLPRPIELQTICVAPSDDGNWYRVMVVSYDEVSDACDVKFLDYGGFTTVNASDLRQIRTDYVTLPFQAVECYLANLVPLDGITWSLDAGAVLEELIANKICYGRVLGLSDDLLPLVHLYTRDATQATSRFVNREMVDRGVAAWVEYSAVPL